MNERIKELAEQAREYARQHVADCRTYGYYMEHNEEQVQFEKKFAELIVQECAGLCVSNIADEICGGQGFSDKIKQHFEVDQ